MLKRLIHEEDIAVINKYVLNNRASKYVKQNWTALKAIANARHLRVF